MWQWEKCKYYFERFFPYFLAGVVVIVSKKFNLNFVYSTDFPKVLDASNTLVALIIGFLGAILPVILGMKNESKIVKYVFEKDRNRLFLKYLKATIFWGLFTLAINMTMYLAKDFTYTIVASVGYYIWLFLVVLFLALTYRSLRSMLDLVFLSDDMLVKKRELTSQEKEEISKIEAEFDNGKQD